MKDGENKRYLGDLIGNNVAENQMFDKVIHGIENLGETWLKENIDIYGRKIVTNTLLIAKISYRASVNGISRNIKAKMDKKIKEFIWGGINRKTRLRWEIMTKITEEGSIWNRDPIIGLDVVKIKMQQKLISRSQHPLPRWVE